MAPGLEATSRTLAPEGGGRAGVLRGGPGGRVGGGAVRPLPLLGLPAEDVLLALHHRRERRLVQLRSGCLKRQTSLIRVLRVAPEAEKYPR